MNGANFKDIRSGYNKIPIWKSVTMGPGFTLGYSAISVLNKTAKTWTLINENTLFLLSYFHNTLLPRYFGFLGGLPLCLPFAKLTFFVKAALV